MFRTSPDAKRYASRQSIIDFLECSPHPIHTFTGFNTFPNRVISAIRFRPVFFLTEPLLEMIFPEAGPPRPGGFGAPLLTL